MTTFQSMFDAGACTLSMWLESHSTNGSPDWSGTLVKGESSPVVTAGSSARQYQALVTADGIAQIVTPDDSGWPYGNVLVVAPQFDVSALQTRMTSMGSAPGFGLGPNSGNATNDGTPDVYTGVLPLSVDESTGAITPSESDFAAAADAMPGMWLRGGS